MKKILTLLLVLFINTSMCITSYAADNQQSYNDDLQAVLNEHLDETEYQKLSNKSKHHSSMLDVAFENKPIIKVYNEIFWNVSDLPIRDIVKYANLSKTVDYIVFDESPLRLRMLNADSDSDYTIGVFSVGDLSKPVSDIQKISKSMTILDTACIVTNIYFFDGFTSHMGASVYYITTEGNFVKYYKDKLSEGVWFTETDYRYFAAQYYNYLISPENNYNEDGEPVGGTLSFLDFITNVKGITPDVGTKNDITSVPFDVPMNSIYLFVGTIVFGIIVIGCVGVIAFNKITKKKIFAKKE